MKKSVIELRLKYWRNHIKTFPKESLATDICQRVIDELEMRLNSKEEKRNVQT